MKYSQYFNRKSGERGHLFQRQADSERQFYRKNGEKIKEGLISENKGQAEKERQKRNGEEIGVCPYFKDFG